MNAKGPVCNTPGPTHLAEREGFEPSNHLTTVTSLAGKRLQPDSATSPRASDGSARIVAMRCLHREEELELHVGIVLHREHDGGLGSGDVVVT